MIVKEAKNQLCMLPIKRFLNIIPKHLKPYVLANQGYWEKYIGSTPLVTFDDLEAVTVLRHDIHKTAHLIMSLVNRGEKTTFGDPLLRRLYERGLVNRDLENRRYLPNRFTHELYPIARDVWQQWRNARFGENWAPSYRYVHPIPRHREWQQRAR